MTANKLLEETHGKDDLMIAFKIVCEGGELSKRTLLEWLANQQGYDIKLDSLKLKVALNSNLKTFLKSKEEEITKLLQKEGNIDSRRRNDARNFIVTALCECYCHENNKKITLKEACKFIGCSDRTMRSKFIVTPTDKKIYEKLCRSLEEFKA